MNICFVLPQIAKEPVGGYKVVFEYANRLIKDGFKVSIVFLNQDAFSSRKIPKFVKKMLINYRTIRQPKWFNLDNRIKKISITNISKLKKFKNTQIAIATDSTTVYATKKLFPNAKKIYFIQGFEIWNMSKERLFDTYNQGFKKIVISRWLKKIVDKNSNEKSIYIQNAIDTQKYQVINPINKRNKYVIGMLFHTSEVKGTKYTLAAIKQLHEKKFPELKLIMFGVSDRPKNLPSWVTYYQNASQATTVSIYNKISLFAVGSVNEGFGLTGLEAMACGAALVSSDFPAVHEYAIDGQNAMLSPTKNVEKMKKNIEFLIENDNYRKMLAQNGANAAKQFSWEIAYKKFKNTIVK